MVGYEDGLHGDEAGEIHLFDDIPLPFGTDTDIWYVYDGVNNWLEVWSSSITALGGIPGQIAQWDRNLGELTILRRLRVLDNIPFYLGNTIADDSNFLYDGATSALFLNMAGSSVIRWETDRQVVLDGVGFYHGTDEDIYWIWDDANGWLELWSGTGPLQIAQINKDDGAWQFMNDIHLVFGDVQVTDAEMYWDNAGTFLRFYIGGNLNFSYGITTNFSHQHLRFPDTKQIQFGSDTDWSILHDGTITLSQYSRITPGIGNIIDWDMPIGAGGVSGAPHDYRFRIDGDLLAGLIADTDGAGSYEDPVFLIPYYAGDWGAGWGTVPAPAPFSLQNGAMFVVHNTNGTGACRLYVRSINAWKYTNLL